MITTAADFKDEIIIPFDYYGVTETAIDDFIAKYEPDFLQHALGAICYLAFEAAYAASIQDPDPVALPQKWADLLNGCNYTLNGKTYIWKGIKPLIRNYIYYWYVRDNETYTTPMGEARGKSQNAERVSYAVKMCRAWNENNENLWRMWWMLRNRLEVDGTRMYPEYVADEVDCRFFYPINTMNI